MVLSKQHLWERFQQYYTEFPALGLALDLSQLDIDHDFIARMDARLQEAFDDMSALEAGHIANPDEHRMVGHYWLRNPRLAPSAEIRGEIEETWDRILSFSRNVHSGKITGANGPFRNYLLIGIGGSVLGPQFVAHALGNPLTDKLRPRFLDNTDPDGIQRVLAALTPCLGQTLCAVVSKSGATPETRNGMVEAKNYYEARGLEFAKHAVAITRSGSQLDKYAAAGGWLNRFPMWDWVGGRTSETSAVGLLPAALQGFPIDQLLAGAKACDVETRNRAVLENPSALLALAWFKAVGGRGEKCMVILPYKDRLELLSRYLQQLVMESLGKEVDLGGNLVHQGITVFGNKGSTDQHSYIQQLTDGLDQYFITFIEVLKDQVGGSLSVEGSWTSGDYLNGFLLGTRQALFERERSSISITVHDVSAFSVGVLIALFERAVGFYASLIGINAYHQPGVEAGKRAATAVLDVQQRILQCLARHRSHPMTLEEISDSIHLSGEIEQVFKACEHLAANEWRGLRKIARKPWHRSSYFLS